MARWIKGQSGNPKGRPRRGRTLADLIKQIGTEVVRFDDDGEVNELSRRERLARILWTAALEGDTHCARLILEYTEGKPVQPVEVSGELRFTADELARAEAAIRGWSQESDASGGATSGKDQESGTG